MTQVVVEASVQHLCQLVLHGGWGLIEGQDSLLAALSASGKDPKIVVSGIFVKISL